MESLETDIKEDTPAKRRIAYLRSLREDPDFLNKLKETEKGKDKNKEQRIRDNFSIFDRDQDGGLKYDEVLECLRSIDWELPEEETKFLYDNLAEDGKGITEEDFFLFVLSNMCTSNCKFFSF